MRSLVIPFCVLVGCLLFASAPSAEAGTGASLEYVGSALWTGVNEVACRDTLVFAAFQYGLQVLDIADPAEPRLVTQFYLPPGGFVGIVIQGNYAYLAASAAGVLVIDISNPASPHLVSWCETPGSASALTIGGNYLYVADTWAGVQVINVADPEHPVIEGTYDTPGDARGIALYGDCVLIADGYDGGLQIVNVALPQVPYPSAQLNTDGIAKRVVVEDHYAYVADADGGVVIVDITDPTRPVRVSTYPQTTTGRYAEDVAVNKGIVYFAAGYLKFLDATDPENPQLIDTMFEAGYCNRVIVSGGRLFSLHPTGNVTILNIDSAAAPAIVGQYRTPGEVERIAISGTIVSVGSGDGVHVLDVSDPTQPVELFYDSALFQSEGVAAHDGYVYFADADSGTHVIDIRDPEHPAEVNRFWSTIRDVEVTGNSDYLCVSGYNAGATFYQLSDPAHPLSLGTYSASYLSRAMCDGRYGYLAARYSGFQVINLRDSAAPYREGWLQISGIVNDIALDSPYVYIAEYQRGLLIASIENPAAPASVSGFSGFPGAPHSTGIAYSDGVVILTAAEQGISAIDVSDRSRPVPVAVYNSLGTATRVAVSGDLVYVADLFGVTILRLVRPTDVRDDSDESLPKGILLARNYPNPFNPRTTIEFTVPRRVHVRLAVYNILGEEVAVLVDREVRAGTRSVAWEGRDAQGREVASGVYLYHISAGEAAVARKMLLLK